MDRGYVKRLHPIVQKELLRKRGGEKGKPEREAGKPRRNPASADAGEGAPEQHHAVEDDTFPELSDWQQGKGLSHRD